MFVFGIGRLRAVDNKKTHDCCQPWVLVEIASNFDKRQRRRLLRRLPVVLLAEFVRTLGGNLIAPFGKVKRCFWIPKTGAFEGQIAKVRAGKELSANSIVLQNVPRGTFLGTIVT
jgi:hypothetical protein